ncbi:Nicotinate-nucleotide--dimethylbenzimidazole phosphoribosyltransferase [Methyloligella halotolerans]|uniref:Nicotinate-nucleotide--dimethylbenzimidazole phosphoribosyltransferase n=1 Tax=Methyloligella halotolerans TaxID=1177755 RepID=A0A1E2S1Q7_9HYPH|nr:nicotinate-nucleotide--dimethylbenzimidazole phosphoribosyltransferase [Methyloligella halotolerans]ODA68278.1 Nicotinate-nucleotide--dimethylbenzimidazole phosphoribosyltransferase [Methyloligella halotolerans]
MKDADWFRDPCPQPSKTHEEGAEARQTSLTKPPGSLGVLERLAVRLAGLQGTDRPKAENVAIVLFAGDHGITAQGVSPYPSDVTVQMLGNFIQGGAAISVLSRELNASLEVVDAGSLAPDDLPGVVTDKPRRGTGDFSAEPAMTAAELAFALAAGRRAVERAANAKPDVLVLGEMGIGNTTSAAAITASLLDLPPVEIVGAGAGLDDEGIRRKAATIADALQLHGLTGALADPLAVLQAVGGLEIAALAGAMIAAAQARIPVLVDGFIVTAAALTAARINPACRDWLIFSHRSFERGHQIVLQALEAEPLLDLRLRLGEGSGAAVAVPLLRLACALHAGMATFEEASVSGPC